uniref:Uncharacterized protein n=1 Tax=Tanacetum cinerariifolium TaxID=118510 RepID=A0A6L2L6X3_TANCI|nr:hypothetical protein [Tanacetum cinerariifolium]
MTIASTISRLKPEPITDVKTNPNTKPIVITFYRGTDRRNFKVYNPFNLMNLGLLNWMNWVLSFRKKNKIISELMTSLGKRYERLKKILEELRIQSAFLAPAPEQASSQLSGRKRKIMELEPEIRILVLESN